MAKVCQEVNHTGFRETFDRNRLTEAFEWCAGHSVQSYQEESGSDDVNDPPAVHLIVADALSVVSAH